MLRWCVELPVRRYVSDRNDNENAHHYFALRYPHRRNGFGVINEPERTCLP